MKGSSTPQRLREALGFCDLGRLAGRAVLHLLLRDAPLAGQGVTQIELTADLGKTVFLSAKVNA
eukprot:1183115-Prorocentrum_minimum.AAC.2